MVLRLRVSVIVALVAQCLVVEAGAGSGDAQTAASSIRGGRADIAGPDTALELTTRSPLVAPGLGTKQGSPASPLEECFSSAVAPAPARVADLPYS